MEDFLYIWISKRGESTVFYILVCLLARPTCVQWTRSWGTTSRNWRQNWTAVEPWSPPWRRKRSVTGVVDIVHWRIQLLLMIKLTAVDTLIQIFASELEGCRRVKRKESRLSWQVFSIISCEHPSSMIVCCPAILSSLPELFASWPAPASLSFRAPKKNEQLTVSFLGYGIVNCGRDVTEGRPEVGAL